MKKAWKKNDTGVSPVIATILMVAITVVLAAVLYVMVMNINTNPDLTTPLGLNLQARNTTSVTLIVSSAPTEALITGSTISMLVSGTPVAVTNVRVYDAATLIATYEGASGTWTYSGDETADTAKFAPGTSILIYSASGISTGDSLLFSSSEKYYEPTTYDV